MFTEMLFKPLALLVGSIYPAYLSFKALEDPQETTTTSILTYWLVYSLLQVAEVLLSFLIKIIPLYFLLKVGFLIWLQAPQTKGATRIYRSHLLPLLKQHASSIDRYLEEGKKHFNTFTVSTHSTGGGDAPPANVGRTE